MLWHYITKCTVTFVKRFAFRFEHPLNITLFVQCKTDPKLRFMTRLVRHCTSTLTSGFEASRQPSLSRRGRGKRPELPRAGCHHRRPGSSQSNYVNARLFRNSEDGKKGATFCKTPSFSNSSELFSKSNFHEFYWILSAILFPKKDRLSVRQLSWTKVCLLFFSL